MTVTSGSGEDFFAGATFFQIRNDEAKMIKVMVVARSLDVRLGLSTVLDLAESIEVSSIARSISEVLEQSSQTLPDVVLVDLEMPGWEGFEILRQMRLHFPSVRTIALTAHDLSSVHESALQAGAVMVMVKGIDVPEMVSIIQAASHAISVQGTQLRSRD